MNKPSVALLIATMLTSACGGASKDTEDHAGPGPQARPSTYAGARLGALDRGDIEKTRQDMLAIATALGAYASQTGEYPEVADYAGLKPLLTPNHIRRLPATDAWGRTFVFKPDVGDSWRLIAPGHDGQVGSGDDIVLTDFGWEKLPEGYRGAR